MQIPFDSLSVAHGSEEVANRITESDPMIVSTDETRPSGRLWDPVIGLSESEVEEWEQQGRDDLRSLFIVGLSPNTENRVQWHRAWAEMMRWLEEYELKHVEFQRCIESFRKMHTIWDSLAEKSSDPGYAAFARHRSCIYHDLKREAETLFIAKGNKAFQKFKPEDQEAMLRAVIQFRAQELDWLRELAHPPKA
jgi:hypothetical protein